MSPDRKSISSENKNISISGDVQNSVVSIGDNTTIIQKFFNIFKSDSETLEHRNRRILLGHVENAWIKGVLDASLHGAALLDLGIKQDPEAVTKYPWAIKKESTDETLPAGTSMLEIFDSIGMGRSLLILGAPGSGKTTMLLELARQLIQRALEDVTYPIPMVFNLASWTEKLTLAGWLTQELNNLYSVPRKTAPDWVKGDKLLLLLDGLDEVRQESRAKCVEAINEFRKEHGLTSLAVCSRSQDYADLNAKLSFEGAIEVQPLTQKQITEFFNRFGKGMAGVKQVLKKDSALREMAETPLFLSIMIMAYRDKQDVEILVSGDQKARRKHLFDTYIERMFEWRAENIVFKEQNVLHWLSWVASKIIVHNAIPYVFEEMQPKWLDEKNQKQYKFMIRWFLSRLFFGLLGGLSFGLLGGILFETVFGLFTLHLGSPYELFDKTLIGRLFGLFFGILVGLEFGYFSDFHEKEIYTVDSILLKWNWKEAGVRLFFGLLGGLSFGLFGGLSFGLLGGLLGSMLLGGKTIGLSVEAVDQTTYPGQKIIRTASNFIFVVVLFCCLTFILFVNLLIRQWGWDVGISIGLSFGLLVGLRYGGAFLIQHYTLRLILASNNLLPWKLIPFLDHCVDLIFLRRVGGGYIFVHRLLMEHFAEMYVENPTSKGN